MTGSCPDADRLAGLAIGEGDSEARRALADHVVGCPNCAADFRLLREMHHEASRGARGRRSRGVWLAAGLAAVIAGVALLPLVVRPPVAGVRGGDAEASPPDGAVLQAPPERLAWMGQSGARGYRVRLFRGDATPVWESGVVPDPVVTLPAEVREGLGRGGSWYWSVESVGPVQRRRMGPFWFQLRGP